jgi:hypothetical protein
MLGSSRAKPLAVLVRFEAIKKDEASVASRGSLLSANGDSP